MGAQAAGEPAGRRGRRLYPLAQGRDVRRRGLRLHPEGQGDLPARGLDADRLRLRDPLRRRQLDDRREGQQPHRGLRRDAAQRRHRGDPDLQVRQGPEPRLAQHLPVQPGAHQDQAVVQKGEARREHCARQSQL